MQKNIVDCALNNHIVAPSRQTSFPQLVIHDVSKQVAEKEQTKKKRTLSASTLGNFASVALSDDDETVVMPQYYFDAQGNRVPSTPIQQMTEEKRQQLYTTTSHGDFAARCAQLQQNVISLEEHLLTLKKRQATLQGEMRNMLLQYLTLERELVETQCRLDNTLQTRIELLKRQSPNVNHNTF